MCVCLNYVASRSMPINASNVVSHVRKKRSFVADVLKVKFVSNADFLK